MTLPKQQTDAFNIKPWSDYAEEFKGSPLLLGNGFAIRLNSKFDYSSLFDTFKTKCTQDEADFFNKFGTTNFEAILYQLTIARHINQRLNLPFDKLDPYIKKLRDGLIHVIKEHHPEFSEIPTTTITKISEQLDLFGDIFTTNYDLYLYHIVMESHTRYKLKLAPKEYQDYFWLALTNRFQQFAGYQNEKRYKHVYYLHGALFLFPGWSQGHHTTLKIKREPGTELLNVVRQEIENGAFPLFVSEGSSKDKLTAINNDSYLSFALENLHKSGDKLVIYGSALAREFDQHIIDAINNTKRDLAVSLYVKDKSSEDLQKEQHELKSKLTKHNVSFFDSSTLF